jgi:hypothetical protein
LSVVHRITGYSRANDTLVEQHVIPHRLLSRAKDAAQVRRDDPDAVWSYPLNDEQAQHLARMMHIALDTEHNEYFLEAFAVAESGARLARGGRAVRTRAIG